MEGTKIKALAAHGIFHHGPVEGRIEETHISWVILTKKYAFKIKKPVKFSFLDFSTLRLRKKNCERELQLNSRFSDIYLAVVPVRLAGNTWYIAGNKGKVVDYAVQMERMAIAKRMDNLLRKGKVNAGNISSLAKVLASFHRNAETVNVPFNLTTARNTFNDVLSVKDLIKEYLGKTGEQIVLTSVQWSGEFLERHAKRFAERVSEGFKRDVHGDFHSGNIFLYKKPVIFDCIEFNDAYRQIDVLYEIAFLCMDLEAFQQRQLAEKFLSEYVQYFNCFQQEADVHIFSYYKCLRANIRAKVHALRASQAGAKAKAEHLAELKKYLFQITGYLSQAEK